MGRISALTELTSLASDDYLVVLDSSANIAKKITIANAFGIPDLGYTAAGESWTYASATTITVPTDATTKYGKGMIIKFTQTTGGTKYAVLITVAATLFTIRMLNGATLANEAITSPSYTSANPLGATLKPSESLTATVSFFAYLNSAQNTTNGTSKVNLNAEHFDEGSNFDSSTNYRFTAPIAGIYNISGGIRTVNAAAIRLIAGIYKNGANYLEGVSQGADTFTSSVFSVDIKLAANDYIELYVTSNGVNGMTIGTAPTVTYLSGHLVGRT